MACWGAQGFSWHLCARTWNDSHWRVKLQHPLLARGLLIAWYFSIVLSQPIVTWSWESNETSRSQIMLKSSCGRLLRSQGRGRQETPGPAAPARFLGMPSFCKQRQQRMTSTQAGKAVRKECSEILNVFQCIFIEYFRFLVVLFLLWVLHPSDTSG